MTDVRHLRSEDLLADDAPVRRAIRGGVDRRRQWTGVALAVIALPLLTLLLEAFRDSLTTESDALVYLLAVVGLSAVGGMWVGCGSAVAAVLLTNYFFVVPRHTLRVAQEDQAIALGVFLIVAATVAAAVDLAARRGRAADRADEHTRALTRLGDGRLDAEETLGEVLENARRTFSMGSVTLRARGNLGDTWSDIDRAGHDEHAPVRFDVAAGPRLRLVGRGPALFAEDQRVLGAFAAAARTAYEGRRLSATAETLAVADRQRVGLLSAAGHDLRTPLAGIKASAGGLRAPDAQLTDVERNELLETIEDAADRLERVVTNLLDVSRLEAGALAVHTEPLALDAVVGQAVLSLPGASARVSVQVGDDLPPVRADPGLLERLLANLLDNALRHGQHVTVTAVATEASMKLEVTDDGPGVAPARREAIFAPYQRDGEGLGLGLAIAREFAQAMDGTLIADGSDGSGLTVRLRLPLAP